MSIRYPLAISTHFFLRWHYGVSKQGVDVMYQHSPILLLPNHTAYIDPILLLSELYDLPICPMVDERFMRHGFFGRILRNIGAVEVPDLAQSSMSRSEGAEKAGQLTRTALDALSRGQSMIIYPSGHVKTVDREIIGNRRLAYEICSELPENTRVVLCRMRGLETSAWSKLKPKQWKWRRHVNFVFEDHTEDVRQWANTLDRKAFNEKLEQWYNLAQ